jgi:hypothetical protein
MDLSLAPSLNGWSAGRWLPQLEVDTCSFDFVSIPDPLRLRHEGVVIRRNEDAPEDAVSDWCDRAHQCLRFLAATDPSRIWIWQEQVLPILLALSSTLAARRAGLSARRALTADQSPIRLRRGQGAEKFKKQAENKRPVSRAYRRRRHQRDDRAAGDRAGRLAPLRRQ